MQYISNVCIPYMYQQILLNIAFPMDVFPIIGSIQVQDGDLHGTSSWAGLMNVD